MYRIAVMGDYDSIYGFATLGLDTYPVSDLEEAKALFKRLAEGDCAVIYMTESLMENLKREVEKYSEQRLPAVIPIPGIRDNTGVGITSVKEFVEKAVGSDILFGDN